MRPRRGNGTTRAGESSESIYEVKNHISILSRLDALPLSTTHPTKHGDLVASRLAGAVEGCIFRQLAEQALGEQAKLEMGAIRSELCCIFTQLPEPERH